jgi:glutamate formiminotransferase
VAEAIAKAIRHIGGGFRFVKAMGVELADRGQVQVSINMTNFRKTPLHRVFECVKSEAERSGVAIVGSEIVGLTPAEALFMAAEHYLQLENLSSEQIWSCGCSKGRRRAVTGLSCSCEPGGKQS